MKRIGLAAVVLALCAPARAIELSLEENRAARGSVGFVDMQRVFAESPDSARAKESFDALVREAEERVNLKKAELVKMRQELAAAKAERERLSKAAAVAPLPPPTPAPRPPAASTPAPAAPSVSSGSARGAPAPAALPGLLPLDSLLAAPLSTTTVAVSTRAAAVALSTSAAAVALSTSAAAVALSTRAASIAASTSTASIASSPSAASVAASTAAAAGAAATGPSLAERVLDLDRKILGLQGDLTKKEEAYALERGETDRGLVSIEGRKTDQVLARVYRAITEVARQEGLSIVIDKSAILYGHRGVDLTDKVLQYLRSSQP